MNWILSKLVLFVAWIAHTLDSDYLRECVNHFYFTVGKRGYGYELKHHWFWITLPKVRKVHGYESFKMNLLETKPMDTPSGIFFKACFKEDE